LIGFLIAPRNDNYEMPADFLTTGRLSGIIPSRGASSSNDEIEQPDVY
jgi:hypothetical protein